MDCKEAVMLFPDYLDGTLEGKTRRSFEEHLDGCAFCNSLLETYMKAIAVFRQSHEDEMPQEVSERLRTFLSTRLKILEEF
jgi:predicted anti-sigma-YlaC factor YlaD